MNSVSCSTNDRFCLVALYTRQTSNIISFFNNPTKVSIFALCRKLIVCRLSQGTDGESVDVSEPGTSVDVGDSELVYTVEHKEEDNFVASGNEMDSKETEPKENEAASRSSFSEPGSPSESERELKVEVKTEEELVEENVSVKDDGSEKSPAGRDVSEDTNMDKTSEELPRVDEKMDPDTEEDVGTQQEEQSHGSKLRVSTADDLDEMMDIGTVDQVEQEAQMKEEQQENSAMDVDCSRSPSSSNTGKVKVCV